MQRREGRTEHRSQLPLCLQPLCAIAEVSTARSYEADILLLLVDISMKAQSWTRSEG